MADQDDIIRDQLMKHGDNGLVPRETNFYFYDGDLAAVEYLARAAGFNVTPAAVGEGVVLTKAIAVDRESFALVVNSMAKWAAQTGSDFDGWECQVVQSN